MSTCRDISALTPLAQEACKLFIAECYEAGLKIFITETYRSQERQDALYAQGRTTSGNIVTWTKNSRHTSRRAWDIACNGANLYDKAILTKAGEIAGKLGITWGGTWATPDMPHFEIEESWEAPEMVTKIKIKINGATREVDAINKDGYNYIKLRDLADEKIKVDYDEIPIVEVK